MKEIMPYIWIGIILSAAALQLNTLSHISVWFIPAGMTAFISSLFGAEVWMQVMLFFILAPVLFILSRTLPKKIKNSDNSDLSIGKAAIVTKEINNYKNTGEIRINGLAWEAQAEDDDVIYETGLVITVVAIDGLKAICSR